MNGYKHYMPMWKTLKMKQSVKNKNKSKVVYLHSMTIKKKKIYDFLIGPAHFLLGLSYSSPLLGFL